MKEIKTRYDPVSLNKNKVKDLIKNASAKWEVYGPLENMGGDIHFSRINSPDKLNLDYSSLLIPPKTIGFPQLEMLFEFKQQKIKETVPDPSPKLLFGLRACDLKGILFVDDFFKKDYADIYYLNRIKNRLLVVIGCKKPPRECFCTSTKTGPFLKEGFDLQLVDIGSSYVVEIGSKAGKKFINDYKNYFIKVNQKQIKTSHKVKSDAEKAVTLKLDFDKAVKNMNEDEVPKEIYENIAEKCLYCGGCMYVCPTCTCFNVFDNRKGNSGIRYRNWDTCVFEGYTRETSGNNPRAEKWLRTSRRYEHKIKYDQNCVGCGRCLDACPVDIGISQFIEQIQKYD